MGLEGLGFGVGETEWAKSTINSAQFHRRYQDLIDLFHVRLAKFIEYTQNAT